MFFQNIFNSIFSQNSIIPSTIRILATHKVQLLLNANLIIVMENGKITDQGEYNDLSHLDFHKYEEEMEIEKEEKKKKKANQTTHRQISEVCHDSSVSEKEANGNKIDYFL